MTEARQTECEIHPGRSARTKTGYCWLCWVWAYGRRDEVIQENKLRSGGGERYACKDCGTMCIETLTGRCPSCRASYNGRLPRPPRIRLSGGGWQQL